MKKNWFIIAGVILVIVGAAVSYFGKFPLAEVIGLASSMFGAGAVAAGFWSKREKTDVLSISTIVCVGAGAFLLGFGGFVEDTMATIITGVIGLVAIVAGLITGVVSASKAKEPEKAS